MVRAVLWFHPGHLVGNRRNPAGGVEQTMVDQAVIET